MCIRDSPNPNPNPGTDSDSTSALLCLARGPVCPLPSLLPLPSPSSHDSFFLSFCHMTIIVPFVPLRLLLPPLAPFSTFPSTSPSSLLPSLLLPLLSFLLRLYVVPISSSFLPIFVPPTLLLFCSLFFFRLFPSLSFSPLLLCHALPLPSSPVLLFYTYISVPMTLALLFSSLNPYSASISFLSYRHSHVSLVLLLLAIYS